MATSLKIPEALEGRIDQVVEARQQSHHRIMLKAIQQYVDRELERMGRLIEAQQAWEKYRENGMHLTGDEVLAWIDTWDTPDKKEAPKCDA